jgi:hypothetical protein
MRQTHYDQCCGSVLVRIQIQVGEQIRIWIRILVSLYSFKKLNFLHYKIY